MYLFFALSGFVNAITSTLLGIVVYLKDRKNAVNKSFAFFCFCVALWSYSYIMWPLAKTAEDTLFWFRVLHIGSIFISVAYLHFIAVWLNLYKKIKWIIWIGYLIGIGFVSFIFSPLFIKEMVPKFSMRFWANPGILYHYYLGFFFLYAIISFYLLLKTYLITDQKEKKLQIKYFMFGVILGYFGGSTNYFLWYNINIPPYLNILVISYVVFTAYAILKHHLFDIKVIATEIFTFFVSVTMLVNALYSERLVYEGLLKGGMFVATTFFGYLLIRSVLQEVKQKERLAKMTVTLQKANEELRKLDDAKTEFISIASHQLRTPLTAIKGFISMMAEGDYGKFSNEQMGVLRKVFASNERLIRLVENLLDISRMEQGRMNYLFEKMSVEDLAEDIVDELKETAKIKKLKLSFVKNKKALLKIIGDEQKLRQVYMNLIDNAIKYTEKGSIEVKVESKKDKIIFSVKDTGAGIAPEEREYLFKRFSRGNRVPKLHVGGSGLGLYVALKITEAHQGKIWVESPGEGKGSTFFVSLPMSRE